MEHKHIVGCGCIDENETEKFSLYRFIDVKNVVCLNEKVSKSCLKVFKPEVYKSENKLTEFVESDDDETMIFIIPFDGNMKIRKLTVIGGDEESAPSSVSLFKNRDDLDYSNCNDVKPLQTINLVYDPKGDREYDTNYVHFQDVEKLILYFRSNFGADSTKIHYIGLQGIYSTKKERKIVDAKYELIPQPKGNTNSTERVVGGMGY